MASGKRSEEEAPPSGDGPASLEAWRPGLRQWARLLPSQVAEVHGFLAWREANGEKPFCSPGGCSFAFHFFLSVMGPSRACY